MHRPSSPALALSVLLVAGSLSWSAPADDRAEKVDLAAVTRIRDESFNRSKAQETLSKLTDEIGPRLTGSPSYRRAAEWVKKQFEEWGLAGARIEPVPFGRGWVLERVAVHMVAPDTAPIEAYPKAWTPGTEGPKQAQAVYAKLEKEEDFTTWKGKLDGKIVLTAEPPEVKPREKADATRLS